MQRKYLLKFVNYLYIIKLFNYNCIMTYRITVREFKESEELNTYEVEADSEQDAIISVTNCEGRLVDSHLMYEDLKDDIQIEECILINED